MASPSHVHGRQRRPLAASGACIRVVATSGWRAAAHRSSRGCRHRGQTASGQDGLLLVQHHFVELGWGIGFLAVHIGIPPEERADRCSATGYTKGVEQLLFCCHFCTGQGHITIVRNRRLRISAFPTCFCRLVVAKGLKLAGSAGNVLLIA